MPSVVVTTRRSTSLLGVRSTMKRPIELSVALAILVAEYLAVPPGFVTSFISNIRLVSSDSLAAPAIAGFLSFIIFRPLVLYLLWRGTNWVRTCIIWVLPFSFAFSLIRTLIRRESSGGAFRPSSDLLQKLAGASVLTYMALFIGFLAFLVLYTPRVRAWFIYLKETRRASRLANA